MSPPTDAHVLTAPPTRVRVFVNRLIFRGMLFTMGAIAVVMYRVIRNKNVTWAFAKAQARNLIRMCGVTVHLRGLEHLTGGPYIYAPNHQSHFDIAALLGYLPGNNRFAAKKEMFDEPILGAVLRTMGMIPIDRDNPLEAIDRLNRLKDEHYSTIIFPEGTRSRDGNLLPFKKGPFVAAIHLGLPIVPVVCKGTQQIMPKGGYLSIVPGEAEVVVLEPILTAGMTYDDRDRLRELVRERIAEELKRPFAHRLRPAQT
ncbi:MAG TPA: lysophospholipid acyltransferase family protein [Candidatus Binatia bacterium]|nr:lysophospholipid acyltransferase family protein [Candidatus Binatia bacterium]